MSERGSEIMDVTPQHGSGTRIEPLPAQTGVCGDPDQLEEGRIVVTVDHEVFRSRAATNHGRTTVSSWTLSLSTIAGDGLHDRVAPLSRSTCSSARSMALRGRVWTSCRYPASSSRIRAISASVTRGSFATMCSACNSDMW